MTRQIAAVALLVTAVAAYIGYTARSDQRYPIEGSVDGYAIVDLHAMGNFPLPATASSDPIPLAFGALDGRRVCLDGFMYDASESEDRSRRFLLFYNATGDHGPPDVPQRVDCTVAGGRTAGRVDRFTFIRVMGTLHVGVRRDANGQITSVYRMDVDRLAVVH